MNEKTIQQIRRALRKAVEKFPTDATPQPMTDLYLQLIPESGEVKLYDDRDNELTRCVVEEWIGSDDNRFCDEAAEAITRLLRDTDAADILRSAPLPKPYSLICIDENHEFVCELLGVEDEDTILLDGDLMQGLDGDLDAFWAKLAAAD